MERRRSLLLGGALTCFVFLAGCGEKEPCLGLHVGDELKITIIGQVASSPGTAECIDALDLEDGRELDARVNGYADNDQDCRNATVSFEPFGAWTWRYAGPGGPGGDFKGYYRATDGTCSGYADVRGDSSSLPSARWESRSSNLAPPASLLVSYDGDAGGDPACVTRCAAEFGIDLRKP